MLRKIVLTVFLGATAALLAGSMLLLCAERASAQEDIACDIIVESLQKSCENILGGAFVVSLVKDTSVLACHKAAGKDSLLSFILLNPEIDYTEHVLEKQYTDFTIRGTCLIEGRRHVIVSATPIQKASI